MLSSKRKWDERFIQLCDFIAKWSKDPSTKVGAVITDGKRVVSVGFNGFPQGVDDNEARLNDRQTRLLMTVHAEHNAIDFARRDVAGMTLYCTHPPCTRCTSKLIQHGIKRAVWRIPNYEFAMRWAGELTLSQTMLREAGVEVEVLAVYPVEETQRAYPALYEELERTRRERQQLEEILRERNDELFKLHDKRVPRFPNQAALLRSE